MPTKENWLPSNVMLHAPEDGPNPENKDADIDPVAYAHERVILATPNTLDTTAVKAVPEPDAILQATTLSDTQA